MPNRLATDSSGALSRKTHAKVGIAGCNGRVGKLLVQEILSGHWTGLSLIAGSVRPGHELAGKDLAMLCGQAPIGAVIYSSPEKLFEVADLVIDFTKPEATAQHAWLAAKHHKPLIIGTTGLGSAQEQEITDAARECAILKAANMSVGVNLLLALVEQAAARLGPEWDIEIAETHHKHKADSPSGTALALGRAAAKGRNDTLDNLSTPADRTGKRETGKIGFSVQRGGDVVGEHTLTFFSEGERLELGHKATNRALFARGALRAAQWIMDKPYGLYSMRDVLGL